MEAPTPLAVAVATLDLGRISAARWFAGGTEPASAARLVDAVAVPESEGGWLLLADITHVDGAVERYLLPARIDSQGALDEARADDPLWRALGLSIITGASLTGSVGAFAARPGELEAPPSGERALSSDQSNTSIVLGECAVVKCYRRPEQGPHPEPELLAGLARVGSRWAPAFGGSLVRHAGGREETLACVYAFVPGEPIGWEHLIERLRTLLAAGDLGALDALAGELGALGAAAAGLHLDLGRAFGIETATARDAHSAVTAGEAQLDEALARATPELAAILEPRADRARLALSGLRRLEGTPVIRCHGDLHVGQFIASREGPVVVDFEGEPGRPLSDRRRHASPLRDLACLLLSLDHTAAAAARRLSFGPALDAAFAWSEAARANVGAAYRAGIAGSGLASDPQLLHALEVEKECREVIYAATVLPEWSYAAGLTIGRLLDALPPT